MKPTLRFIVSIGLGFIVCGLLWIVFLQPSANINPSISNYQQNTLDKLENRVEQLEKNINTDQGTSINTDPWYMKYLLPSILTLFVGIISFYFSQLYMRYLDSKKDKEKYLGHLKVISEEIKRNLDLECQIHAYLYVNILPTFDLSFFITEKIFSELSSVCRNYDLLKKIFHKYFEYRHIQNRLDDTKLKSKDLASIIRHDPDNKLKIKQASDRYDSARLGTILLVKGNIKGSYSLFNAIISEINSLQKKSLDFLPNDYLEQMFEKYQSDEDVVKTARHNTIDIKEREKFY